MAARFCSTQAACVPTAAHVRPRPHTSRAAAPVRRQSNHAAAAQQRCATLVRAQSTEQQGEVVDKRAGRSTYRPASYTELVDDAVAAVAVAVSDGLTRLEVEFPAVSNVDGERRQGGCQLFFAHCILCASCYTCTANASSAGYKGASDLYIDANIQLALAASRKVRAVDGPAPPVLLPQHAAVLETWSFRSACSWTHAVLLAAAWPACSWQR